MNCISILQKVNMTNITFLIGAGESAPEIHATLEPAVLAWIYPNGENMKKQLWLLSALILLSVACQTLISAVPTATRLPETVQPTIAQVTEEPFSSTPPPAPVIATSTLRPVPVPIECTDDACLNACLERIEKAVPQTEYQPLTGPYADSDINLNLVYYEVDDGRLGEPKFLYVPDSFKAYQQDTAAHQSLWQYASGLLPPDQLKWISGFEIFSSTFYGGWVAPSGRSQDDRSQWVLGIEITNAQYPLGLTYILVHEFGHLITLNTDQIPASEYYYNWNQNPTICPQFLTPEGCSATGSYINQFYEKFWKGLHEEWVEEVGEPIVHSAEEYRGLVAQFHDEHSEQFVDEYAATNIKEDLAESFMFFVLSPRPNGEGVPAQKIRFFYDFPEMVALRQQMIENICAYTGQ